MNVSPLAAWAVAPSLPNTPSRHAVSHNRRPRVRTAPFACAPAVSTPEVSTPFLTADQKAVAEAAVKVTNFLKQDSSSLTTLDLLAFCNVKSISLPQNVWDRTYLQSAATKYLEDELLARIKTGPDWDSLSVKAKIKILHRVCNGEGDVTYVDPATGYTVFTFFSHFKRGHCCGIKKTASGQERTHRCRHCPYKDDGTLGDRMNAIKERVPLVEYVRKRVTESSEHVIGLQLAAGPAQSSSRTSQKPGGGLSENELGTRYSKVAKIEKKEGDWNCKACSDENIVTCTRCSGWTYLFSPELMKCPQCNGKGYHPCIHCTSFRPPQRDSFYS